MTNIKFNNWINTFIEEKGIDTEQRFHVEGPSGTNSIPVGVIVEHMIGCGMGEQRKLKNMIVRIDFANGDVLDFFKHLAKAIAI